MKRGSSSQGGQSSSGSGVGFGEGLEPGGGAGDGELGGLGTPGTGDVPELGGSTIDVISVGSVTVEGASGMADG